MTLSLASSLASLLHDDGPKVGEAGPLHLPVLLLREDPDQPRDDLDTPSAQAALEELAGTIRARGVLQPITVRPVDPNTGLYTIRYGHRRFRASKLAGLDTVPVIVREDVGDEVAQIVDQILENEQREPLSVSQLARSCERLSRAGMMAKDIATALGKPKSQISYLMAIVDLPPILAPLADTLGARTVAELKAAHDLDAKATAAFLKANTPDTITQVSARALAQALKAPSLASEKGQDAPAAPDAAPAPPKPASASASQKPTPAAKGSASPSPAPEFAQANRDFVEAFPSEHAALSRLLAFAVGRDRQAEIVARFLLSALNALAYGGFDIGDLYELKDPSIISDVVAVFAWHAEQDTPILFEDPDHDAAFQAVLELWGPEQED